MGKWTRRAFITAGVAAGGVVVFGVAIRRGDRSDKVRGLVAADGESLFDVWLKIAPDNTIAVRGGARPQGIRQLFTGA
jgi:isoquinoline 1-oxidoreductase beta subunit